MNLKERGLTIGDLVILSIIIIFTIFSINKIKDNDKQTQNIPFSIAISSNLST